MGVYSPKDIMQTTYEKYFDIALAAQLKKGNNPTEKPLIDVIIKRAHEIAEAVELHLGRVNFKPDTVNNDDIYLADDGKYDTYGDALKAALKINTISQTDFSEKIGVSRSQLGHWCNNIVYPRPNKMQLINNALHPLKIVVLFEHYEVQHR